MSVTVAVGSPAPGKTSFVPGPGATVAAETRPAAEGGAGDFAAMMREANGTPAAEAEGTKPGKAIGVTEGRKARKGKIEDEGSDPAAVISRPEAASVATVPIALPASALASDGDMAGSDDGSAPVSAARKTSAPSRPAGEVMAPAESDIAENIPATVAPAKPDAPAGAVTDAVQARPAAGKKQKDASPDAIPEPKEKSEAVGTTDAVRATKAQAAPPPSAEVVRTARQAASPSPADPISSQVGPTPARTGRPREEGDVVGASPNQDTGEAAPQPVRAGEATALLAMARRADRRTARAVDDVATTLPAADGKPVLPAKGAGATQASPVAIAAVQAGPAAVRMSGGSPKAASEQPDSRADNATEDRSVTPTARGDAPAATGATTAPQPPLSTPHSVAAAGSASGALSGALDRQVVDMGVSGQWIDDIARQIASVAANPGHGRFRIASEALGAVRVDLTPGKNGSDVLMTVDSDAARTALTRETDRLMQDARLASVRLGEVRVERAVTSADAPRSDTSQRQDGGQGAPTHAQATMGQGGGQADRHSTRHDAGPAMNQQQGGNSPKTPFIKSVLHDSGTAEQSAQDRGRTPDRARYA